MNEITDWWDKNHKENNNLWLSGYSGEDIWKFLKIENRIIRNNKVLNIGVGTGKCTKDLFDKGMKVYALDISEFALDKVKDYTIKSWDVKDIWSIPPNFFDLVISHLVTQHMSDEDLKKQIKIVLEILNDEGIFAMQFASNKDNLFNEDIKSQKVGGVCRTLDHIKEIVNDLGGKLELININTFGDIIWNSIHIKKSDQK